MSERRWPTFYIPHGGGPCFFMDVPPGLPPDMWDRMAAFLRGFDAALGERPNAVLVISGHWLEPRPTVNIGAHPPLLFDYYNFPPHTYRLTWPAPGAPWLGERVRELLAAAGFESDTEAERGYDHGVFIPFKLIYPEADVPVLQLSLRRDMDAAAHIEIGRALAPLRDEDVLIVGSGMSYHNLRHFYSPLGGPEAAMFDEWLGEAVAADPGRRDSMLARWWEAPGARHCQPQPDHLLPLMVAAGAAADSPGQRVFGDRLLGKAVSGFRFG